MSVLVTDGNQRSALAVVRALGRSGIRVTVGETGPSLAGSSRYCTRQVSYPSPVRKPAAFLSFLQEATRSGQCSMVLPMTDVTTQLVAESRDKLPPEVAVPIPSAEQVRLARDKREVLLLARKLGIACPETYMPGDQESLEDIARRAHYPVVIKPRFSRFACNGSWITGEVKYAYGPEDLLVKYRQHDSQIPGPLVQERVAGEGRGIFLLVWNGELKAAFCHRRLREKPPWGGVSVLRESLPLDWELVEQCAQLLKAMKWQGVAMVEFKRDQRDQRPKLMEINGRFWGSLQLAIDAGINFPLLLYRLAAGEEVKPEFQYRAGVKTRWLLGDLDRLLIQLRHRGSENGFSQPVSRLRECVDFLKFYEKDLHYEIERLDDPRPGWVELKSYVRDLLGHRKERPSVG